MFFLVDVSVCMRGAGGVWRLVLIELKQRIKTKYLLGCFWRRTMIVTVGLDPRIKHTSDYRHAKTKKTL